MLVYKVGNRRGLCSACPVMVGTLFLAGSNRHLESRLPGEMMLKLKPKEMSKNIPSLKHFLKSHWRGTK